MNNMKATSATRKRNQALLALSMALLATIIVVAVIVIALTYQGPAVASKGSGTPTAIGGHGTATTVRGHGTATPVGSRTPVGSSTPGPGNPFADISHGNYAFDTARADGQLKLEASTALNSGNTTYAVSLWNQAVQLPKESGDAEALVYLEDQRVVASGKPYITFVVGTILSGANVGVGRDNLQGAYVAQKQYNDGVTLPNGVLVRLLIANADSKATNAANVAQEIVQLQKIDTTIVGVMG
ncbi:MAG TPA: hypothetical protein VKU38_14455, partial [Ktedonobacteraceae bacterium]|nr:hypothetical protein [Ktedonobacteraceae bacterium]